MDVQTAVRSIYQLDKINLDNRVDGGYDQDSMYAHILAIKNCSEKLIRAYTLLVYEEKILMDAIDFPPVGGDSGSTLFVFSDP